MFDELKEVKCFRFQKSYVKYFKEIKRLKSLQKAEYLEPKQASVMELFLRIYVTAYCFCNKGFVIDV